MKRYGTFGGSWASAENISYGSATGREIVLQLLIDDGVSSRGHRAAIMNGSYTQTGAGYATHPRYRASCTITYTNGYTSNDTRATPSQKRQKAR